MGQDLLVRGGTVVDGTGAPAGRADVRINGGVITEVGPELRPDGEHQLDAGDAYVIPGIIEAHTHYDGALWWDPDCDPMPAHGTTTVVLGNCGLGLAPLRPADRAELVDLFCFIEDLPTEVFLDAIPWDWQTWEEYTGRTRRHRTAVNAAAFFPHQLLRVWVMGREAWERPASAEERAAMARMLAGALADGAFGLSTSVMDTDRANRLVPSRMADDAELDALAATVAAHPGAVLQCVPRFLQPEYFFGDLHRFAGLAERHHLPVLWAGYGLDAPGADTRQATHDQIGPYLERGVPLATNFSARPSHVNIHFERSIMWSGVAAWHDLVVATAMADKRAMLTDEAWRQRAKQDWDECRFTLAPIKLPGRLVLIGGPDSGRPLDEVADRQGRHPSDVLADWLLSTELEGNLRTVERPVDDEAAADAVRHPWFISGASDAGAHIQMFNGAGDSTYLLAHLARDRGLVSLEEAVHAVTGKQAAFFGLAGRGRIATGAAGDLAVFDIDELVPGEEVKVADLPGGSWRYSRTPGGYRATVVGGEATFCDGAATGQRPGRWLRRAAGAQ